MILLFFILVTAKLLPTNQQRAIQGFVGRVGSLRGEESMFGGGAVITGDQICELRDSSQVWIIFYVSLCCLRNK